MYSPSIFGDSVARQDNFRLVTYCNVRGTVSYRKIYPEKAPDLPFKGTASPVSAIFLSNSTTLK